MTRYAYKNKYKNKKKKIKTHFSFNFLIIICVAVFIFVGAFYLYEVNSATVKSFKMKELEKKVEVLKEENKKIGKMQAEYESMKNTHERIQSLNMIASRNVEYVTVFSGEVAKR